MPKETNVLLICLLILFADVLSIWQTVTLRFGDRFILSDPTGLFILAGLGFLLILLIAVNYTLIRRIIARQRLNY